jgi:hypothetical protein
LDAKEGSLMNPLPQEELAALMDGCLLHRARSDDALYVSDAPRRLPEAKLGVLETSLSQHGFVCVRTERGLWKIDLSAARYRRLYEAFGNPAPVPFPADERNLDVYALTRLLTAHPAPRKAQPMEPLRAVLKRYARPAELRTLAARLLPDCAERLRKHQSLPYAAAGLLARWLREAGEEERS